MTQSSAEAEQESVLCKAPHGKCHDNPTISEIYKMKFLYSRNYN